MSETVEKVTEDEGIERMVDHVLRNTNDIHVVIGPVVGHPSQDHPYFIIATSEAGRGFRCDQIGGDCTKELRSLIIGAFTEREPLVIHDCDDELYMARLCETLWPGERIAGIRKSIERERAH